MSGSAVFSATIEEITSSTPKQSTVRSQTRARDDKPASAKSPGGVRVNASTTQTPFSAAVALPPRLRD